MFKKIALIKEGLLRNGKGLGGSVEGRIGYDQCVIYTCMEISQWNLLVCTVNTS